MNKKIMLTTVASGIFLLMGNLYAEEPSGKTAEPQPKKEDIQNSKKQIYCPIMGNKVDDVDRKLFVDYKGKRIYVCCSRCLSIVKADPEKYIKALEAKGIVLDETPKDKAPAEGKDVEKKEEGHAGHQH
jgi:YHS domain-containing protein